MKDIKKTLLSGNALDKGAFSGENVVPQLINKCFFLVFKKCSTWNILRSFLLAVRRNAEAYFLREMKKGQVDKMFHVEHLYSIKLRNTPFHLENRIET